METVKLTLVATAAAAASDLNNRSCRRVEDGSSETQEIFSLNLIMEDDNQESSSSSSYSSISFAPSFHFDDVDGSRSGTANESSYSSRSSTSSDDLMDSDDEDSDSFSSSPNEDSNNLFDLSELMSQLPIKRGLSKFYNGKSQSFKSLARVTSLEDLAKSSTTNGGGYGKRIKACKSYAAGLNNTTNYKSSRLSSYSPKATISKKSSSPSCSRKQQR